jgi:hypothetical protein
MQRLTFAFAFSRFFRTRRSTTCRHAQGQAHKVGTLLSKPRQKARENVSVKLLPQDQELYVFAESRDRVAKERAMRRRQLKWL